MNSWLKGNNWGSLDAILTSFIQRGVTNKAIIHVLNVPGDPVWDGAVAFVESALPRLKARGSYAVEFGRAAGGSYGSGMY